MPKGVCWTVFVGEGCAHLESGLFAGVIGRDRGVDVGVCPFWHIVERYDGDDG